MGPTKVSMAMHASATVHIHQNTLATSIIQMYSSKAMQRLSRTLLLLVAAAPLAMAMLMPPSNGGGSREDEAGTVKYLYQGWGTVVRQEFHYGPQGSELIPYDWFLKLPKSGSSTLLKDNLGKFGVLYDNTASDPEGLNPDHLPIGFAKQLETRSFGKVLEGKWLGLTCAACHTGAIVPKDGTGARIHGTVIIDGAPSGADVGGFFLALRDAVQDLSRNPDRLKAFAKSVSMMPNEESADQVETKFKAYALQMQNIFPLYVPKDPSGPGRLDCFGAIFNRVGYDVVSNDVRKFPLNAPVNFPFLWYTDRQDKIQWNGTVGNGNWLLRLSRNVGEVTGVFAQYQVKHNADFVGFKSSVNISGLSLLDLYLKDLTPPKFSDVFRPSIADLELLERARHHGKDIFQRTCQTSSCHADSAAYNRVAVVNPTPLLQNPNNNPWNLPDLNTDPNNTQLANLSTFNSGIVTGSDKFFVPFAGKLKPSEGATTLLAHLVIGTMLNQAGQVLESHKRDQKTVLSAVVGSSDSEKKKAFLRQVPKLVGDQSRSARYVAQANNLTDPRYKIGYESRALDGIWATAPYLHNGSVPNLHALLWPEERKAFYVGSRIYDPVLVGFVSDDPSQGVLFDPTKPGNSNKGHTYGSWLTDDEKNDLIEYLKTL